jgi:hypothetical protein
MASATVESENFFESMGEQAQIALIASSAFFGTAGIVCAIANHVEIDADERPHYAWRFGGYTSGGINVVLGIFYVVGSNLAPGTPAKSSESWFWAGISHIVVGGASIGLAAWGGFIPEKKSPGLSVAPIVLQDSQGKPALGIGLQLVDW